MHQYCPYACNIVHITDYLSLTNINLSIHNDNSTKCYKEQESEKHNYNRNVILKYFVINIKYIHFSYACYKVHL